MALARFGALGSQLGEGSYGTVFRLGRSYALKRINNNTTGKPSISFIQELGVTRKMTTRSRFTIPLEGFEIGDDHSSIVMPLAEYSLDSYMEQYDTAHPEAIMRDVAMGIYDLHSNNVIHLDLKPANILFLKDRWVLADFGLALDHVCGSTHPDITRGTVIYMAPEILRGENASLPSDIWSLGCIFYEILTEDVLFGDLISFDEVRRTRTLPIDEAYEKVRENLDELDHDEGIINLIISMLNPNPLERPDIVTVLKHSFLSNTVNIAVIPPCIQIHQSFLLIQRSVMDIDDRTRTYMSMIGRWYNRVSPFTLAIAMTLGDAYSFASGLTELDSDLLDDIIYIAAAYISDKAARQEDFIGINSSTILTVLNADIHYSTPLHVLVAGGVSDTPSMNNVLFAMAASIITDVTRDDIEHVQSLGRRTERELRVLGLNDTNTMNGRRRTSTRDF